MIYDISMPIHKDMQVYKNKIEKRPIFEKQLGSTYETSLTLNLHTGTHIDFPLHTIENGGDSNNHSLEPLIGKAKVLDLMHVDNEIDASDLENTLIKENDFILLKTKNSLDEMFNPQFIYINESAARYLASKSIRGVGIDGLGIERSQPNHPSHNTLFNAGIIILEGLRLKEIKEDIYDFICLPLNIKDVEALPVRVVLMNKTK